MTGVGRLGAIVGALLGTALLTLGLELHTQCLLAGAPAVLAGIAVALTRGRHLSQLVLGREQEVASLADALEPECRNLGLDEAPRRRLPTNYATTVACKQQTHNRY